MSVLVTGGAGYIGSHMVWDLVDAGESVVVLDRLSTGFEWAVAPEAELVVGDIADMALVERLIAEKDIQEIIHFAGSIVVPESVADPLGYYLNNTVASRALIEAAVKGGVKHFIFSSTAAVYGSPKTMPVPETQPPAPESPYGTSKWMTELMLRDTAAAHPITFAALRYFNVAGADPKGRAGQSTKGATHLIKVASETALGKRPFLQVFGNDYDTPDGTCVRDYIHVSDLASAHRRALDYLRGGGASIIANCGYGHGYSVLEVLDTVRQVVGRDFDVRMAERRPGDASAIVADATTARQAFGWEPLYDDLPLIVRHALDWEEALGRRNAL
ncbi:UDP-glucose 4-epimerase GalE [uncultured Aureimonas sp.]|uniref:UDP-glucose 4-epimerase GalE n=1 Tax=uncultured Aureimonas sp. TaxID=1604662 RepID=UPI0025E846F8|nr:UDP-glucose 4-epimerase GalE [uncultured Aureimonas sp.]